MRWPGILAGAALVALISLESGASAALLTVPHPPEYMMRGIVGQSVSIALPTRAGYAWDWDASGDNWLFDPPYRIRFNATAGSPDQAPEVWIFPLVRPGQIRLEFTLHPEPPHKPSSASETKRTVTLSVLTPYEAQQHPPADMRDTLMIR